MIYCQPFLYFIACLFLTFNAFANTLPSEKPPIFNNFCKGAETPADKQSCTQERFKNAEEVLKRQFDQFVRFLKDTPYAEDIKNAQNSWIEYRNKECHFEASFFEEEVAKRTLELSCLSRLTEERAHLLYNFVPRVRKQNLDKNSEESLLQ